MTKNQKSHVDKTIKNMLMKVVMNIVAVLIVNTLRRILMKKARNFKKRMNLV